ncbi:MAG: vWA domain-containing protein [Thiolinea sp.]
MLADFHFMHPGWLWLLLLLPLLWVRVLLRRQKEGVWSDLVDAQLAPFVLTGRSKTHRYRAAGVISLLMALAILAMAGPSWEKREIPAFRKQESVVVGFDLSASMYVRDAVPNRLDAARFKLLDLLQARKDGQTGLVVFAGDAFVVSPLTDDTTTIAAQVKNLSPEVMPVQGSHTDLAILRAIEVLDQATPGEGAILLITDGTTDVRLAREAAKQAATKGYTVSVLAIGTEEGAPIPMRDGGFLTDASGQPVVPRLDKPALKALANAGKGIFTTATVNDQDINALMVHWSALLGDTKAMDEQERQLDIWFNQGIWLVLLLIPVAMLLFRRGWLTVFLVALIVPRPEPVYASVWEDLWLTPNQQGHKALQQGDAATASELFSDPNWQATAAYRAGDYAKAATLYAQDSSVNGLYNYGNALAMQGKLPEAIAAYEAVLEQQPDHEDAKHNLEQLKQQQEEQQQQQGGQQNQQNNSQQQQQGNNGQQSENADNQSAQPGEDQQASPAEEQQNDQSEQAEQPGEGEKKAETEQQTDEPMDAQTREQKQATEQWLRLIPDDPAGLWRRKFQYQYRRRTGQQPQGDNSW